MGCGQALGSVAGLAAGVALAPATGGLSLALPLGGMAVGGMIGGALDKPKMPSAGALPLPANYYQYDSDGNIVSEQVWDAAKNGYISRVNPEPKAENFTTPEEFNAAHAKWLTNKQSSDAEALKKKTLTDQLLANLSEAPEDRVKMYDDYVSAFTSTMKRGLDENFTKSERGLDEKMNATGMTGSRADVDLRRELYKDKQTAETEIGEKGIMAKETLAANDKAFWANLLNQLESGERADSALQLNAANNAAGINSSANANLMARYTAPLGFELEKWKQKTDLNQQNNKMWMDTLSSAGMMYALGGFGGNTSGYRPAARAV